MSVILLSDSSALGTSDEHRAFDLSGGRRLTPVDCLAVPPKPAAEPAPVTPRPKQVKTETPPTDSTVPQKSRDNTGEMPSSGYLPDSG